MRKNDNFHHHLEVAQGDIYDSFEVQDPRGKLMFLCDKKKINWYIKKGLVDHVEDRKYKLKFEPRGKGNENPFFFEKLSNACVVCGATEQLTKHHIVPYQYRKVLPDEYKSSNHFDVLCVCIVCHEIYEEEATIYKNRLHTELKVPTLEKKNTEEKKIIAINGILYVLKNSELNQKAIDNMLLNLGRHIGRELTHEEALKMDFYDVPANDFYEKRDANLMKNYLAKSKTYEDFILSWRKHFLHIMNPKFMPKSWMDSYKTFFKKTV